MGKGVTVTSVLLGVFGKRSQLHWYAPQTRFYLSLHTMCPVPPEMAPLFDTQPGGGLWEFLVIRGFRWLEKDASVFQLLLSSGIATPHSFSGTLSPGLLGSLADAGAQSPSLLVPLQCPAASP